MKSLRLTANDLRDLANMMLEEAESLLKLADFFGQPEEAPVREKRTYTRRATAPEQPAPEQEDSAEKHVAGYRPLTPEQKQAVAKDWETIPKHLRTKENRAALAAKYQCSPIQLVALTRDYHKPRLGYNPEGESREVQST